MRTIFQNKIKGVLLKGEVQVLLLSLLRYSEMLSQMITFNHLLSFELLFELQKELEGNLLDQNLDELSRI